MNRNPPLPDAKREPDELLKQLRRLALLFDALLQSRRWRLGNALGALAARLARRPTRASASEEMERILRPYRRAPLAAVQTTGAGETEDERRARWLAELCRHLPRLFVTRRWKLGRMLARAMVPLGRGPTGVEAQILDSVRRGRRLLQDRRKLDSQVDVVLADLDRDVRRLLGGREWTNGKRIGDIVERVLRLRRGEKVEGRLAAVLHEYETWRDSLAGIDAGRDRDRFNCRYREYLGSFEPGLARRDEETGSIPASLRAFVLPFASPPVATRMAGITADVLASDAAVDEGLVARLNAAIGRCEEDWLILLDGSDRPSPRLAAAIAAFLARGAERPAAIVFDHDRVGEGGERTDPVFKPGFSPEWLIEHDYAGRAAVFDRRRLLALGGFQGPVRHLVRTALWDLFRCGATIAKLDRVLLHVDAAVPVEASPAADAAFARWALERRGLLDRAEVRELAGGVEVRYRLPPSALVSIVIPFTDQAGLLRQCLESIHRLTTHPRYELVLVDTRSREDSTREFLASLGEDPRVRVLRVDETFNFSRANNLGARAAAGEFLVFLNNDTKLLTADWLEQLCGYAALEEIGAVGAKLLFADGSLQHAGVVVGMHGFAAHLFCGEHEPFVPASWIRHSRNCSAVTGACLAIERRKFLACGGFDERLTLTGNDVELCLRLLRRRLRNVFLPSVVLFHFERSTRRTAPVAEHNKRLSLFTYRDVFRRGDPYYDSNLRLDTTELLPRALPEPIVTAPPRAAAPGKAPLAPGTRVIALHDLGSRELAANRDVLERFRADRRVVPDIITWFVPHFDHVYRGGIHTVLRVAAHFSRTCGALNRFVFYGRSHGALAAMDEQIGAAFPALRRELLLFRPGDAEEALPPSDLAFCTLWTSAYHLARYNRCRGKFYLVQDFEAGFSREDSVYALAEETYRFGFLGVANTPGVCDMYRGYGNEAEYFLPAVDREIFSPAEIPLPDEALRVVVYGRPDKPRNAFGLVVECARELKGRHGDRVEILSVGAEYDVGEYGLEGVLVNLGLLPDLHAVASVYRQSDVGLVFMLSKHPSYQPLEYMASGCAVVTNVNEANLWLLRHRENSLVVPPLRTTVVEAIEQLMWDADLRHRLVGGGLETVARIDWEEELDTVYRFVTTGEPRGTRCQGATRSRSPA